MKNKIPQLRTKIVNNKHSTFCNKIEDYISVKKC